MSFPGKSWYVLTTLIGRCGGFRGGILVISGYWFRVRETWKEIILRKTYLFCGMFIISGYWFRVRER